MQNSSAASNLVAESWNSTDGRQSWNIRFGLTNQVGILFAGSGYRVTTNTAPDGSFTVSTNSQGQLISVTRRDSGGSQLGQTRYGYDYQGRPVAVTDARTGTQSFGYNNADQVTLALTTSPGNGQNPQSTSYTYDTQGRVTATSLPDGGIVSNDYLLTGELRRTSGTRTYPVGYSYDYQGRLKTMTNWSTFSGLTGPRVTTWNFSTNRGFLISKAYPDSQGPSYTYTSAGRLKTRVWARGITTTYTNNTAGDVVGTGYSDGVTTNVILTLDRIGRPTSIIDGAGTHDLTLHDSGLVLLENNSSGLLSGLNITNAYDSRLRRTSLLFRTNSNTQFTHTYGYDAASRMTNVSDGTYSATYSYLANSPLVSQIAFNHGTTNRMTTTKAYDYLNRLTQISSTPSGSGQTPFTFNYGQNDANQRVNVGLADNSHWVYEYDSLGQVTSGKRYWSDGTPVAGQQFEYSFDDIGNRTSTRVGGDSGGAGLCSATYGANTLNQYTNRTVSGTFDVLGIAHALATTTVNTASTYRKGEYFKKALTADNSTGAVYQAVTAQAVYSGATNTSTGSVFLAKSPENFTYDADGNLTSDGRWTNRWDAENRLVEMQPISGIPASAKKILHFNYDARGRRASKTVSNWTGSAWALSYDNRFVYDNWNLIAEVNKTNNAVVCSYMWGLDLSGTPQRAGGAGGLLAVSPSGNATHFVAFDGNGNVVGLVGSSTGTNSANYEYGPFGETIRLSGSVSVLNPMRFSTKYQDVESDLLYYGFRYYAVVMGRWISRDEMEERGGLNLLSMLENNAVSQIDFLGLVGAPPPLPVPGGNPQNEWVFKIGDGSRGGSWVPKIPVQTVGGGQPSVSWDPQGHWDFDLGNGMRQRVDRWGNEITADQAHNPPEGYPPRIAPPIRTPKIISRNLKGAAILAILAIADSVLAEIQDSQLQQQYQTGLQSALSQCQASADRRGLPGCNCCIISVFKSWSQPGSFPNFIQRHLGIWGFTPPSGEVIEVRVLGDFQPVRCPYAVLKPELVDPTITTYEQFPIDM